MRVRSGTRQDQTESQSCEKCLLCLSVGSFSTAWQQDSQTWNENVPSAFSSSQAAKDTSGWQKCGRSNHFIHTPVDYVFNFVIKSWTCQSKSFKLLPCTKPPLRHALACFGRSSNFARIRRKAMEKRLLGVLRRLAYPAFSSRFFFHCPHWKGS